VPDPDYIISDVGATVVERNGLEAVESIQQEIEKKWPGNFTFRQALAHVDGLIYQEVPQQRRCSFYMEDGVDLLVVKHIAEQYNCDVLLSADRYLDILPKGVSKGDTLKKLIQLLGFPADRVLVA